MMNPQPLQARPYVDGGAGAVPIPMHAVGGGDFAGFNGGHEEEFVSGRAAQEAAASRNFGSASRTSELTIAFEGEVYVFPAVTPEKVGFLVCLFVCSNLKLFERFLVNVNGDPK